MQELVSVAENASIPPDTLKSAKKERIPKRVRQAISMLVSGRAITQKAAAEAVGMHEATLCRQLKRSTVRVFYEREARDSIARGVMRASARLMDLVDGESEHVSFDAAKHVLGIAGIKPSNDSQVSVSVDIRAGYVIDLSRGLRGERVSQAVEIIDASASDREAST